MTNRGVSGVAWTIGLPHFFHGGHDHKGDRDMMEELAVSVHENYFTFKGWARANQDAKPDGTLTEKFCRNYSTFRQWSR